MNPPRYEVVEEGDYFYVIDRWLKASVYKTAYKHTAEKRCERLNRNWKKKTYIVIQRIEE